MLNASYLLTEETFYQEEGCQIFRFSSIIMLHTGDGEGFALNKMA